MSVLALMLILGVVVALGLRPGAMPASERAFLTVCWIPAITLAVSYLLRDWLSRILGYSVILVLLAVFLASLYLTVAGVRLLIRENVARRAAMVGPVLLAALPAIVLAAGLVSRQS